MSDLLQELGEAERKNAAQASFPEWMDPILARLTHDAFSDDDWIYGRKLDGERMLAYLDPHGGIRLLSRHQVELNDSYPEIEQALRELAPRSCVLDGEMVAFDEQGVSDFQKLQPRMQSSSRHEASESDIEVF